MTDIAAPECRHGYPWTQIGLMLPRATAEALKKWMYGQTMAICDGQRYDAHQDEYVQSCGGVAHGPVVYTWDLRRFLDGRPVID